ncbi:MAG: hypothetical protein EHM64_06395 [Ignavibacteriae bacterium]|nr:MAG: hypothetical protein EHM64_06395 [Ignavibacteriota bacterium]
MEKKQVVVGEYENEIEAEIAKGHLQASGIPAVIVKGGGLLPSLRNAEGVQLVVDEPQSERAKKIIQEHS